MGLLSQRRVNLKDLEEGETSGPDVKPKIAVIIRSAGHTVSPREGPPIFERLRVACEIAFLTCFEPILTPDMQDWVIGLRVLVSHCYTHHQVCEFP